MKKFLMLPLVCLLLLTGCSLPGAADESSSCQFFAMDTVMSITAYGSGADDAMTAAQQEINRLEALLSRTRSGSDISKLNAAAGSGQAVKLDPETISLLTFAKSYTPWFDITIAPIMDAWGFTKSSNRVPGQDELNRLLPLVDASQLAVDPTASTAYLPRAGMAVDLGGVAKGYAGDRAAAVLSEHGVTSAILSLGGNITALGTKPDGSDWNVAVKDPKDTSKYICVFPMANKTAATSGGYERFFVQNGVTYHHIIDPTTGYPADSGLLSVTVVADESKKADLLSTYCFVLGADRALDAWRSWNDDTQLVLVKTDGTVLITDGLEQGLDFQGKEQGYAYQIVHR